MRLKAVLDYAAAQPKWFVYAITDQAGKPVYVGSTKHPERRHRQYLERKGRWQKAIREWVAGNRHVFELLDHYPTRRMMLDAEHEYIAYLSPRFNIAR